MQDAATILNRTICLQLALFSYSCRYVKQVDELSIDGSHT